MSKTTRLILALATTISVLTPGFLVAQGAGEGRGNDDHLKIWYKTPARIFNADNKATPSRDEGLPIGNGRIGGMILGYTDVEIVNFNEITLWDGGPKTDGGNYAGGNKKDAYLNLPAIREALFAGNIGKANSMAGGVLGRYEGSQAEYGTYRNMGQLEMDFSGSNAYVAGEVPSDYYRELDFTDGVVRVSYSNKGVKFQREYFCSYPGNIMAARLTADQKDAIGFSLTVNNLQNTKQPNGRSNNDGRTTEVVAQKDTLTYRGKLKDSKMSFVAKIKVVAPGADISADGSVLTVKNGEDVLLLMSAATNYDQSEHENIVSTESFQTPDCDYLANDDPDGEEAARRAEAAVESAAQESYATLLARHMEDYQALFSKATLDLGDQEDRNLPAEELIRAYRSGTKESKYLQTLLFQFGRYILIASSRDSLPPNLRGIWCDQNWPAWQSDYHTDINLQQNYWPAFVTNLEETGQPLVKFMDSLVEPGRVTAKEHYGVENGGWIAHTISNAFGHTAPGSGLCWGYGPATSAWMCDNLWEYYEFTQDRDVLKQIYPIMRDLAKFYQSIMVEDPASGELVVAPSISCEHSGFGVGTTFEMALSYWLMQTVIEASAILDVDEEFRAALKETCNRVEPFKIGADGQLKEWREEDRYNQWPQGGNIGDPHHRHMSHLLTLHPANLITDQTPELMLAAYESLSRRNVGGQEKVGWSITQNVCLYARMGLSEDAYRRLNFYIASGTVMPNLFNLEIVNETTVEANGAYTGGVAEMLIQSSQGYLEPLPALPKEWAEGSFTGLKARGNFEVDAQWSARRLNRLAIRSGSGKLCRLRYPGVSRATVESNGEQVAYQTLDASTIEFATEPSAEYVIQNFPAFPDAPKNAQAVRQEDAVVVTWEPVENAARYVLYRRLDDGSDSVRNTGVYAPIATAETASYRDTDARPTEGAKYFYRVAAISQDGVEGDVSFHTPTSSTPNAAQ